MSPKKNDPIIDTPPVDTEADAVATEAPAPVVSKPKRPEDRSIVSDEWAAAGPNGEAPNVRLRHTPDGSVDRQIHGEWYPARAWVKNGVKYLLPTKDGEADVAMQRAGFYHPAAHRIVRFAEYALIK